MPRSVSTVLTLKDQMTSKLEKIGKTSATVTKDMRKKFATVGQKFNKFGTKMTNVGKAMTTRVTLPLVAVGSAAAKSAMEFEDAMAKVSTIASADVPIQKLADDIKALSDETGVSAAELANNVYDAISAGQKTGDAVNFVEKATKLAKAGFTDSASALDILTTTMNAYGLEAKEVGRVSDVLINTQNLGKTTVAQLASSMGKIIPTAKAADVSLENIAAGYAIMTSKGIATAESTTYMNSMLNELSKNGTKASDALKKKTGKSFQELMRDGNSLGDVLKILKSSAKDSGLTMGDMFGSAEAGKAALTLLSDGSGTFNSKLKSMKNSTGATDKAFGKLDTTSVKLNKIINRVKNTLTEIGATVLEMVEPVISKVADVVKDLSERFKGLDDGQKKMIVKIAAFLAVIGPVLMAVGKLIAFIGTIITVVGKVVAILKVVITVIAAIVGAPAAVVAAVIAGVAILIGIIIVFRKQIAAGIAFVWGKITGFFAKVGAFIQSIPQRLSQLWETIKAKVAEWLINLITKFFEFRAKVKEVFAAIGKAIIDTLSKPFKWVAEKVEGIKNAVGGFFKKAGEIAGNVVDTVTGKNASGTPYWRGGRTLVGEQGPEIVDLPGGSKIYSNQKSQKMTGGAPTINLSLNIQGNLIGNAEYANMLSEQIAGTLIQAMTN